VAAADDYVLPASRWIDIHASIDAGSVFGARNEGNFNTAIVGNNYLTAQFEGTGVNR